MWFECLETLILLICLTSVCCISVPCNETYLAGNGYRCYPCSAGYYKVSDCVNDKEQARCRSCGRGEYMSTCDNAPHCDTCDLFCFDNRQVEVEQCTPTSNLKCECMDGFFWHSHHRYCAKLSECIPGEGVKIKGTPFQDTKCESCIPGETFSPSSSLDACMPCTVCNVTLRSCSVTQNAICDNIPDARPSTKPISKDVDGKGWIKVIAILGPILIVLVAFVVVVFLCVRRRVNKHRRSDARRLPMSTHNINKKLDTRRNIQYYENSAFNIENTDLSSSTQNDNNDARNVIDDGPKPTSTIKIEKEISAGVTEESSEQACEINKTLENCKGIEHQLEYKSDMQYKKNKNSRKLDNGISDLEAKVVDLASCKKGCDVKVNEGISSISMDACGVPSRHVQPMPPSLEYATDRRTDNGDLRFQNLKNEGESRCPTMTNGSESGYPTVTNGAESRYPTVENGTDLRFSSVTNGAKSRPPTVTNGDVSRSPTVTNKLESRPPTVINGTESVTGTTLYSGGSYVQTNRVIQYSENFWLELYTMLSDNLAWEKFKSFYRWLIVKTKSQTYSNFDTDIEHTSQEHSRVNERIYQLMKNWRQRNPEGTTGDITGALEKCGEKLTSERLKSFIYNLNECDRPEEHVDVNCNLLQDKNAQYVRGELPTTNQP